jgi:hypothetical protein
VQGIRLTMLKTQIDLPSKIAKRLDNIAKIKGCSSASLAKKVIETYCQQHIHEEASLHLYSIKSVFDRILYFKTSVVSIEQIVCWFLIPTFLLIFSTILNISYVQNAMLSIYNIDILVIYFLAAYFLDVIIKLFSTKFKFGKNNQDHRTISLVIEFYNSVVLLCSSIFGFMTFYTIYIFCNQKINLKHLGYLYFWIISATALFYFYKISKKAEQNDLPMGLYELVKFILFFTEPEWYKKKLEMSFIILGGMLIGWLVYQLYFNS